MSVIPIDAAGARQQDDPPPFHLLNPNGKAPVLLVCDHASRVLPGAYCALGLDDSLLWRHIAWDIGAADVTRRLSAAIDATAVLAGASRLLIDVNRRPDDPGLIPAESDGIAIPGNRDLDAAERQRRADLWHRAYHGEIDRRLDLLRGWAADPVLLSVHSFTPVMDGYERPWHIGVLWNDNSRIAEPLIARLRANPGIVVGDNQPYTALEPYGYTIHMHGEDRGIRYAAVEIRQDLIDTHHGAEAWANILADAAEHIVEQIGTRSVEQGPDGG